MKDYHDFSTIDSPKEFREKHYIGDWWINAVECGNCGDYIRSKNVHDFVSCSCRNVSVDGGSHYLRRAYATGAKYEDKSVKFNDAI